MLSSFSLVLYFLFNFHFFGFNMGEGKPSPVHNSSIYCPSGFFYSDAFHALTFSRSHVLTVHPIHISVSEIEISENEVTWTARIYKDDLLLGMYGKDINMNRFDEREKIEKDIFSYMTKNISLAIDGKNLKWNFKQIESDPEAIWTTISTNVNCQSTSQLTIHNRILLDVYSDQKNIVNLTWVEVKKNFIFEKGKEKKIITL